MPPAPIPFNEAARLSALYSYDVLDSVCEASFDNIAHLAAKLTGSPISLVSLIDTERQWFKARHGLDVSETPRDQAFCAYAILNPDKPLVVADARLDPRFADNPLVIGEPDILFYAGVPIVNPEGAAIGTLCVIDRKPRDFSADECETLQQLASTVMTTLELRRAMNRVRSLALIDSLTEIPNRAAIVDAIQHAIARQKRSGTNFALLYLDLDGFKRVNDLHGHAAGDQVLRDVAQALTAAVRREDLAGRLGGDEFAIVLAGVETEFEAVDAAERARGAVQTCMEARGLLVTASLGSVLFQSPPDSADFALAAGDELMYLAKTSGKNQMQHRCCAFS